MNHIKEYDEFLNEKMNFDNIFEDIQKMLLNENFIKISMKIRKYIFPFLNKYKQEDSFNVDKIISDISQLEIIKEQADRSVIDPYGEEDWDEPNRNANYYVRRFFNGIWRIIRLPYDLVVGIWRIITWCVNNWKKSFLYITCVFFISLTVISGDYLINIGPEIKKGVIYGDEVEQIQPTTDSVSYKNIYRGVIKYKQFNVKKPRTWIIEVRDARSNKMHVERWSTTDPQKIINLHDGDTLDSKDFDFVERSPVPKKRNFKKDNTFDGIKDGWGVAVHDDVYGIKYKKLHDKEIIYISIPSENTEYEKEYKYRISHPELSTVENQNMWIRMPKYEEFLSDIKKIYKEGEKEWGKQHTFVTRGARKIEKENYLLAYDLINKKSESDKNFSYTEFMEFYKYYVIRRWNKDHIRTMTYILANHNPSMSDDLNDLYWTMNDTSMALDSLSGTINRVYDK